MQFLRTTICSCTRLSYFLHFSHIFNKPNAYFTNCYCKSVNPNTLTYSCFSHHFYFYMLLFHFHVKVCFYICFRTQHFTATMKTGSRADRFRRHHRIMLYYNVQQYLVAPIVAIFIKGEEYLKRVAEKGKSLTSN